MALASFAKKRIPQQKLFMDRNDKDLTSGKGVQHRDESRTFRPDIIEIIPDKRTGMGRFFSCRYE